MHLHLIDANKQSNLLNYIDQAVRYVDIVVVMNFDATIYTDLKKYIVVDSRFKLTPRCKGELVAVQMHSNLSFKTHKAIQLHNSTCSNILNLVTLSDADTKQNIKVAIVNNFEADMNYNKLEAEILLEMKPLEQDFIICTQPIRKVYTWLNLYQHIQLAPSLHVYKRVQERLNDYSLKVSTSNTDH